MSFLFLGWVWTFFVLPFCIFISIVFLARFLSFLRNLILIQWEISIPNCFLDPYNTILLHWPFHYSNMANNTHLKKLSMNMSKILDILEVDRQKTRLVLRLWKIELIYYWSRIVVMMWIYIEMRGNYLRWRKSISSTFLSTKCEARFSSLWWI